MYVNQYFYSTKFLNSPVDISKIEQIEIDGQFIKASSEGTTKKTNVEIRLKRAKDILGIQG